MNEWILVLILLFPLVITWNPLLSLSLSNTESKIDNPSRCNLIDPVTTTQIFLPQHKAEECRFEFDGMRRVTGGPAWCMEETVLLKISGIDMERYG